MVSGGVLTALTAASGYAIYVTNEYLWDTYSPNTNLAANNDTFALQNTKISHAETHRHFDRDLIFDLCLPAHWHPHFRSPAG